MDKKITTSEELRNFLRAVSPDRFPEAWNAACHQADTLNQQQD